MSPPISLFVVGMVSSLSVLFIVLIRLGCKETGRILSLAMAVGSSSFLITNGIHCQGTGNLLLAATCFTAGGSFALWASFEIIHSLLHSIPD